MKLTLRVSCDTHEDASDFTKFKRLLSGRLDLVVAMLAVLELLPTKEEIEELPEWFVTLTPLKFLLKNDSINWRYDTGGWCAFGAINVDQTGAINTRNVFTVLQSDDRMKQWVVNYCDHEGLFDAVLHRPSIENLIRPYHPSDHMTLSLSGEDGAELVEVVGPARFTSLEIKKVGPVSACLK